MLLASSHCCNHTLVPSWYRGKHWLANQQTRAARKVRRKPDPVAAQSGSSRGESSPAGGLDPSLEVSCASSKPCGSGAGWLSLEVCPEACESEAQL